MSAQEAAGLKYNDEVVDVLQNMATGAPYDGGASGGGGATKVKKEKTEKKEKKDKKKKKK